jgi:eukaryotic-like serine/threonine-protein kinase
MYKYLHDFIGQYRLLKRLKDGELVSVYLAEDRNNEMQVVIKILDQRANSLKVDTDKVFLHAGRIMSRLYHPNIVRLHSLGDQRYGNGQHNEFLYLVTSYGVNGSVKHQYPDGSRVPLETIVAYTKQCADALDYAHAQQILHGRLKPENVLLGTNNAVLLSDFGFADSPSFPPTSHTEFLSSSALYMAPEQTQGKLDRASDQYALAIMVYEWFSGKPPFTGSVRDILLQHAQTTPPSLRRMLPYLSPLLEEVIMMALAKNPGQRFMTVASFANALEQAASHN